MGPYLTDDIGTNGAHNNDWATFTGEMNDKEEQRYV